MKKILIILGGVLGLLVVAAIVIPLVVDVDKYRPVAVQAVNDRINGKFELGRLKLSLWGQIRVDVASLTLADSAGRKIVAVQDAYFHFPFMPLLSGSPVMTLKLKRPEVAIVTDKNGKMNVMTLMKATPEGAAQPGTGAGQAGASGASGGTPTDVAVPGIAARARLGLELLDADILMKDEKTEMTNHLRNFNVVLKDMSLSRPWEVKVWGDLDTKMAKVIDVKGPISLSLHADPKVEGGRLTSLSAKVKGDFDGLEIRMPGGLFEKAKGIAANIEGTFSTAIQGTGASTVYDAKIEKLTAKFFNAEVQMDGGVRQSGTTDITFALKTNEIDLKPWNQLIPVLKDYELAGIARLTAKAGGPSDKIEYSADFGIRDLAAKSPTLKAQPKMDLAVQVLTDRIEKFTFTMKAPGNDLAVEGKMTSFTKPALVASVRSTSMDLDQLLVLPPLGQAPAPAPAAAAPAGGAGGGGAAGTTAGATTPGDDYDKLLDPMRINPMMVAMTADLSVQMGLMKVYDVKMTEIAGRATMRNLAVSIDSLGMKLWGGSVKMTGSTDMKPAKPTYSFNADVASLSMQQAVESQFKLFKNTLIGDVSAKMSGTGSSYNPTPAMKNLNAKGNFKAVNARLATIDVGKMTAEGISGALQKIGDKIPSMKGKTLHAPPSKESRYALISSDLVMGDGKFSLPNFVAKAEPNSGIDLTGRVTTGMIDYSLDAYFEVIDTYNLTKARDLSLDVNGVKVEHVLAKGNDPVRFPVTVGCTAMAPCYKYTEVPEYLGKIVAANLAGGAKDKAKAVVQQKVIQQIEQKAPAPVQNVLKGLGKKFFK